MKATQIPDENQVEVAKIQFEGCGQNMVVGGRSETRETHHLGQVLEEFL